MHPTLAGEARRVTESGDTALTREAIEPSFRPRPGSIQPLRGAVGTGPSGKGQNPRSQKTTRKKGTQPTRKREARGVVGPGASTRPTKRTVVK